MLVYHYSGIIKVTKAIVELDTDIMGTGKSMFKLQSFVAMALFVFAIASNNAIAGEVIYKWTDTKGQTKYTQSKPPSGIAYTVIRDRTNKDVEAKKLVASSEKDELGGKQDEMIAQQNSEKSRVQIANEKRASKNCTISKNNLEALERTTRIQIEEDGKKRVLTDDERSKAMSDARTNIEKYCI